ncbi:hypothetical protein ES703_15938 [subsurface metagenome]
MKFFSHFSITHFSNCYLLGPDRGGDAVLIDPGIFDIGLLKKIENHKLYIRYVLVTHAHKAHIIGIKTLLKIYDAEIFSSRPIILDVPAHQIRGGEQLVLGDFCFEVIETPGHSSDSVTFKLNCLLFTGDTITAGSIGSTATGYERSLLLASIRQSILKLDDNTLIFPGHGPPTRVGIERRLNPYLQEKPQNSARP